MGRIQANPRKFGWNSWNSRILIEGPSNFATLPSFAQRLGSVEVKMFNELKAAAEAAHGLKGHGDYRSLYVNNNDHANHRPKDPEHSTVEFMCGGDWEISHGGPRNGSGRHGPLQVATAAIKAGTPELQCKTYEEFERLLEAAAESVGGTIYSLPKVPGFFSTVPKRVKGDFVPNPAYDEEVFKALPKQEQTSKRQRTMKYLQGPDWQSLREEVVVPHDFLEGHPPDFTDSGSLSQSGSCSLTPACLQFPS